MKKGLKGALMLGGIFCVALNYSCSVYGAPETEDLSSTDAVEETTTTIEDATSEATVIEESTTIIEVTTEESTATDEPSQGVTNGGEYSDSETWGSLH